MSVICGTPAYPAPAGVRVPDVTVADVTVADVTERLMAEFEDRLDLAAISRTVSRARHELHTVAEGSAPELIERLARQRLLDQLGAQVAVPAPRSSR